MVHVKGLRRPIDTALATAGSVVSVVDATWDKLPDQLDALIKDLDFQCPEQRYLYNWVDVLDKFDDILRVYCKNNQLVSSVQLKDVQETSSASHLSYPCASQRLLMSVLKVTRELVVHASQDSKTLYSSIDHITALLAVEDFDTVTVCLDILGALFQGTQKPSRVARAQDSTVLALRLSALCRGWPTKENGITSVDCCSSATVMPEKPQTIFFEFDKPAEDCTKNDSDAARKQTLTVTDLSGDDFQIMQREMAKNIVPPKSLFELLMAIRRTRAFGSSLEIRRKFTNIRIMAIFVSAQMVLTPEALGHVFHSEAELLSDIMTIACADPSRSLGDLSFELRSNALRCLSAVARDRKRSSQVSSTAGISSYHGALPSLLRAEISLFLMSTAGSPSGTVKERISVVEAAVGLVRSLAIRMTSYHGAASLVSSGIVGTLVPLIGNQSPHSAPVVLEALKGLQCIIENSNASSGATAFHDHGGLELLAQRLADEVFESRKPASLADDQAGDEKAEEMELELRGESRSLYSALAEDPKPNEAIPQPPSSSVASRGVVRHSRFVLLKGLFSLVSLVHSNVGGCTRELVAGPLPAALRRILARPFFYGGTLFASAASVVADMAHAEPTSMTALSTAGIPAATLKSLELGLPPSGEAIRCIPNLLAAVCLSSVGLSAVKESGPLVPFLRRLAAPFYGRAMQVVGTPMTIGIGLDELMRHVPVLRTEGTQALMAFLESASRFAKSTGPQQPEGQPELEANISKGKLTVAYSAARLAGYAAGSNEQQSGVLNAAALGKLLDLRFAPAYSTFASEKSSQVPANASINSTICLTAITNTLKNLGARFGHSVLRQIFDCIKDDTAEALRLGALLGDCWLEEESAQHPDVKCSKTPEEIAAIRSQLCAATRLLRIDIVILTGLSRGPGFSVGAWEANNVPQIGAAIGVIERSARWHLARSYSGITVGTSAEDLDLCSVVVHATSDAVPKAVSTGDATSVALAVAASMNAARKEAESMVENAKKQAVFPGDRERVRKEVVGLARSLSTLVVSAERLYSTLARGLTSSFRRSRDTMRYSNNAKSLSNTIGRLLVLNLGASRTLWHCNVASCGDNKICSAWEYLRGVFAEIRSTIFDDGRKATHLPILESFIAAGGGLVLSKILNCSELLHLVGTENFDLKALKMTEKHRDLVNPPAFTAPYVAAAMVRHDKCPKGISYYHDTKELDPSASTKRVTSVPARPATVEEILEKRRALAKYNEYAKTANRDFTYRFAILDCLRSLTSLIRQLASCSMTPTSDQNFPKSDWKRDDVDLTRRVTVTRVMASFLAVPERLLRTDLIREFLMSDVLPIVHTIAGWTSNGRKEKPAVVSEESAWAARNKDLCTYFADMGFSPSQVFVAVRRTNLSTDEGTSPGRDEILEYLLSHPVESTERAHETHDSETGAGEEGDHEQDFEGIVYAWQSVECRELELAVVNRADQSKAQTRQILVEICAKFEGGIPSLSLVLPSPKIEPNTSDGYSTSKLTFATNLKDAIESVSVADTEIASNERSFIAVELLGALEASGVLNDEARSSYATTAVSQLSAFGTVVADPSGLGAAEPMLWASQVPAVWIHQGGPRVRRALIAAGVAKVALGVLQRFGQDVWEEPPTDDDPQHRLFELKCHLVSSCLLILDAYVRYAKIDGLVKKVELTTDAPERGVDSAPTTKDMKDQVMTEAAKNVIAAKEEGRERCAALVQTALSQVEPPTQEREPGSDLVPACLESAMSLLKLRPTQSSPGIVQALLQLLSSLSQHKESREFLVSRGAIQDMMGMLSSWGEDTGPLRRLLRSVLRGIVEDEETLAESIEYELRVLLAASKSGRLSFPNLRTLVMAATPLWQRDRRAFTLALSRCCRLRGNGHILPIPGPDGAYKALFANGPERKNVSLVIQGLFGAVNVEEGKTAEQETEFALRTLAELAELSPYMAGLILSSEQRGTEGSQSSIQFLLQSILPAEVLQNRMSGAILEAGKSVIRALCLRLDEAQDAAVSALGAAMSSQLEKEVFSAVSVRAVLACLSPTFPLAVRAKLLDADFPSLLAKVLERLDLSTTSGQELAGVILKKLDCLGQAATLSLGGPSQEEAFESSEDVEHAERFFNEHGTVFQDLPFTEPPGGVIPLPGAHATYI